MLEIFFKVCVPEIAKEEEERVSEGRNSGRRVGMSVGSGGRQCWR